MTSGIGGQRFQLASSPEDRATLTEDREVQMTGRFSPGPVPCAVVRKPAVRIGSC